MSQPLPPPRQVPVIPRPRHGELSASYLARVALANRTQWRIFAGLLGRLPSGLPGNPSHLTFTIVTLNEAAFARLLAYTGHDADRLIRAVPSLAPATFARPGEPPALRVATLREQMLDCPPCLLRRGGAFIDTRLFPLRMACLRHGYWLYRDGAGSRLPPVIVPEIARAQKRLVRLATRYGEDAAVRAYDLARYYLREEWRNGGSPFWESALADRWYQRAEAAASTRTSWLPSWAVHPECAALAAVFASPYWAERAVPVPDRRHRLFYQHMLTVLGVDDWTRRTASIRGFGSLPDDIREQAGWGRILSDPEWGTLPPPGTPRKIPFIDITNAYDRPAA
jgi:TniQ